MISKPKGQLS